MGMNIIITVNGKTHEAESGISLLEFIQQLELEPSAVAALVNDEIVERDLFAEMLLKENDVVELIRFVPGG
jgi:thiamine biosynthesis protein ThiS